MLITCGFVLLSAMWLTFVPVESILLSGPVNSIGRQGRTIQLNCRTNLSVIVNWRVDSVTGDPKTIFGNSGDGKGVLYPDFMERFKVQKEDGGHYNLIISNASLSDAGTYICIDNEGFGFGRWNNENLWASADLVIIGSELHCTHNISDNVTVTSDVCELSLQPDYISMNCSINYHGNTLPPFHFTWIIKDGDDVTQNASTQTLANTMVTSTVVVQASEHWNSLQLICVVWIKYPNFVSAESKDFTVVWVSPVLQPMFINTHKQRHQLIGNDDLRCRADTNIRGCKYTWTRLGTENSVNFDVLRLSDFPETKGCARYQCSADCPVREKTCHISNVTIAETCSCTEVKNANVDQKTIIFVVLFVIILFVLLISIARKLMRKLNQETNMLSHLSLPVVLREQMTLNASRTDEHSDSCHGENILDKPFRSPLSVDSNITGNQSDPCALHVDELDHRLYIGERTALRYTR